MGDANNTLVMLAGDASYTEQLYHLTSLFS